MATMDIKTRVLKTTEEMRDEIVDLTAALVRIPSINPRYPGVDYKALVGAESQCDSRLADAYEAFGCDVEFVEKEKGRANLVGILKGTGGGRSLIYNGHIDVVPGGQFH